MTAIVGGVAASLADRYRIERELGAGGMATVYLAHDLRHDRDVAIKVLHADLGAALGNERFLTEIRTTAKLQHPHILPLLDSGEADGRLYYVMPLVAGETLRARLERERQLPIDDSVLIAREVADAHGYAHRLGVVHRDIKPENILLQGGHALVADFGIALAVQQAGGQRLTQTGLSLGTPQYMSPEQAMGERSIDARSDIYALGAVLYEMFTGEPPFTGPTMQAIVARLLAETPRGIRVQRKAVSQSVEAAVLRALEKLPADRFANADEFTRALRGGAETVSAPPARTAGSAATRWGERSAWAVAVVALAAAAWSFRQRSTVDDPVIRSVIDVPAGTSLRFGGASGVAIAPKGDRYAFVVQDSTGTGIIIRAIDELGGERITATQPANLAFSPDGQWLAFTTETGIRKVRVDGSSGTVIAKSPIPVIDMSSMVWASNDVLYAGSVNYGIWKFPASGGAGEKLRPDTTSFRATHLVLSDDEKVLVYGRVGSAADRRVGLSVIRLRDGKRAAININGAAAAMGVVDGRLLFVTVDGEARAVGFDAERLTTFGESVPVADSVAVSSFVLNAALSLSGTLLYVRGSVGSNLVLAARGEADTPLLPDVREFGSPRFSPDGRKVAVQVGQSVAGQIWTYDLDSKTLQQRTTVLGFARPEWIPDGTAILVRSGLDESGRRDVAVIRTNNGDSVERIFRAPRPMMEVVMTRDAKWLVYRTVGQADIFAVRTGGDTVPIPIAASPALERTPRVSPDGRWIAFESDASGQSQIYVQPFPGPGARVQVSDDGGYEPLWSPSGRELFYRVPGRVMAAEIQPNGRPSGVRRVALTGDFVEDVGRNHQDYDVAPDGKHLLMVKRAGSAPRLVLMHNWVREVRARLARR